MTDRNQKIATAVRNGLVANVLAHQFFILGLVWLLGSLATPELEFRKPLGFAGAASGIWSCIWLLALRAPRITWTISWAIAASAIWYFWH